MSRSRFIFDDISTLQPARAVHRRKPAAEMTHQPEHSTNQSRAYLAHFVWTSSKTLQHLADQLPVVPLLVFNLLDASSFFRIPD